MKEVNTTPGKTYSVHTSSGCTVSDKNGWSKNIDAPDGYFTAHAGEVTIDGDDAADVREVFKLAPQQRLAILGVLGGDGGTPAWLAQLKDELTALLDGSKFELAWLAGKNTLVVHTDRVSDELLAAVKQTAEAAMPEGATLVQYNHNVEISWRDITKYAECVTVADVKAVNPDYKNDLTSDGEWVYPLPNIVECGAVVNGFFRQAHKLRKVKLTLPKATFIGYMFYIQNPCVLEELDIEAPLVNGTNYVVCGQIIAANAAPKKMRFVLPKQRYFDQFFWGTAPQYPQRLELYAPKMERGDFGYSSLDKISVLEIFNQLKTFTSGTPGLTIGIHVDHQNDDEVLAAIANAESKGWTMTVRWNGTPTSTASTMSFGSLIYAKVGEMERPDGTTERVLDWGHYVTDWEARGYEQFRSLASAYRYFGLPMPEDLTNN